MGRPDVDAMLGEISSVQFSEWVAYDLAHVSDAKRGAAAVCAVLANLLGNGKRRWSEADFLPRRPGPADEQDLAAMKAAIRGLAPSEED